MHIPDGYLSPVTCAALYASSAPFWYVAMQRIKSRVHTKAVPLISLFAAFSFVIMMFNLPLPGGTTGHAIGIGIAAVILGPWGAMIAISTALIIQALFFGDGGITSIGANCFNIAIIGSLSAYATYQVVAGRSSINSFRRAFAAGAAGYIGINAAALLTAIELGVQPILYKDATGSPLYSPYPLSIAIPAIMISHLALAGIAEFIVSFGIFTILRKHDQSLIKIPELPTLTAVNTGSSMRRLWLGLGLLTILTPLGLLANGEAWGESELISYWSAPISDYAPSFLRSEALGYIASAILGTGFIILCLILLLRLVRK